MAHLSASGASTFYKVDKSSLRGSPVVEEEANSHCKKEVASDSEGEGEGEELVYRQAWSTGSVVHTGVAQPVGAAADLKAKGNAALEAGDTEEAVHFYSAALRACQRDDSGHARGEHLALLHSNRAHAHSKSGDHVKAVFDCEKAIALRPSWPKPHYRLALAYRALGQWADATDRCRAGDALLDRKAGGRSDFATLLDRIAMEAAEAGSDEGFDGRRLEVRCAGDDAWLCKPAPEDPLLDFVPDSAAAASLSGLTGSLTVSKYGLPMTDAMAATALSTVRQRVSFRSVKEAVDAARDGDQIMLLRGTHNGMGEAINIEKRILIIGEGTLGETVIDQRANCPTFRITCACMIRNIDMDMTGFREALMVEGPSSLQPFIQNCIIRCSGDDAVNIAGSAEPLFRGCKMQAKRCGLRTFESGGGRLFGCRIENCGEQGVKAMDESHITLERCVIVDCDEEGVVAMDNSHVTMQACTIRGNKGPGIDVSDSATLEIRGGVVRGNVGGLWLWQSGRATCTDAHLEGGSAHVILADQDGLPSLEGCRVEGTVHATDAAWEGIWQDSNQLVEAHEPRDLPPESGPFVFVPNRFTRKQ